MSPDVTPPGELGLRMMPGGHDRGR